MPIRSPVLQPLLERPSLVLRIQQPPKDLVAEISGDDDLRRPILLDVKPLTPLIGTIDQEKDGFAAIGEMFGASAEDNTPAGEELQRLGARAGFKPSDVQEVLV